MPLTSTQDARTLGFLTLHRLAVAFVLVCLASMPALAQTLTTVYAFKSPLNSGTLSGGLVMNGGLLYGSTNTGGRYGNGEIFTLSPPTVAGAPWTRSILYSFNALDGRGPVSNLTLDSAGNIYGATYPATSAGNIFQLSPPTGASTHWVETILFSFPLDGSIGADPVGDVVFDKSGNLFGVTSVGGLYGRGVVYELSPPATPGLPWIQTVHHDFQGSWDGANPPTLSHDLSGPLFGICANGGTANAGTVWRLYPPTVAGGAWSFRVLHTFAGGADGTNPSGMMIFKGVKYGTTSGGGQYGFGTIFHIVYAGGVFTTSPIYSFTGRPDGIAPVGNLVADASYNLYGVTSSGGAGNLGTVYELSPPAITGDPWIEKVLHSFSGIHDGEAPQGRLLLDSSGNLFGVTTLGIQGATDSSRVFEVTP